MQCYIDRRADLGEYDTTYVVTLLQGITHCCELCFLPDSSILFPFIQFHLLATLCHFIKR